jgi:hypothetical protein
MTQTIASAATLPVVRALLDEARRKNYDHGVLGVRARPEWTGADTFSYHDVPVHVVRCESALAVREALLDRHGEQWLVILTDRPEDDLGAGLLSHLLWHRLRTPDPWDAVRHRFAATGIDPALVTTAQHREIATGLLAATPPDGWPPAPGGVLTRDHALASLARVHLHLGDPQVDAVTVLAWTTDPMAVGRVAALRALAGDALTDVLLDWVARLAGAAADPVRHLFRQGDGADAVPLGLVLGVLAQARESQSGDAVQLARDGLVRLENRLGGTIPPPAALRSWAVEATAVTTGLLLDPAGRGTAETVLARADDILLGSHARGLAVHSDLLPAGLTARLDRLAAALRDAVRDGAPDPAVAHDDPQVPADAVDAVERAWTQVAVHQLTDADRRIPAFRAAVRLVRWLATPTSVASTDLQALVARHGDADAWVDSAVNDAAPGVGDADLGAALLAVLAAVRVRRDAHDVAFAVALAAHTSDDPGAESGTHHGVRHLEDLLPGVVLPLALKAPVLFLVLDGMSTGVGTEVIADVLARATDGWAEALLPGQGRRSAALAVLPTLTHVSRASLLCGELRTGGQDVEQRGYATLTLAYGLPAAKLYHKKPLDSSRPGFAVGDDVGAALDDVAGHPLVTCVLNTIDDALDRSDPAGTDWGAQTVKHLMPLLDRARLAGRMVVVTADHGHVVERRQGTQKHHADISSGRSRDAGTPAGDGEILVAGPRVLEHGGRAVLAVDERLRYGPLKAGYHGGGAAAEAVVPVTVLVPGAVPDGLELRLAPPQEPPWWTAALPRPVTAPTSRKGTTTAAPVSRGRAETVGPVSVDPVATAVVASPTYATQRKIAGRVAVTDEQILALLSTLRASPAQRLSPTQTAIALAVAPLALRGAISQAQRLLNVEGYAVLHLDADGATLVLDEQSLREQFEVPA